MQVPAESVPLGKGCPGDTDPCAGEVLREPAGPDDHRELGCQGGDQPQVAAGRRPLAARRPDLEHPQALAAMTQRHPQHGLSGATDLGKQLPVLISDHGVRRVGC
ncbi:MAG: hypothetical protein JWN97_2181 [Nocardioides sp.]|nr:hypothetical protein [Nocardioides sp.]